MCMLLIKKKINCKRSTVNSKNEKNHRNSYLHRMMSLSTLYIRTCSQSFDLTRRDLSFVRQSQSVKTKCKSIREHLYVYSYTAGCIVPCSFQSYPCSELPAIYARVVKTAHCFLKIATRERIDFCCSTPTRLILLLLFVTVANDTMFI